MNRLVFLLVFFVAVPVFAGQQAPAPDPVLAPLVESAADEDPAVRQAAVRNLGESRNRDIAPFLARVLTDDPDEAVRVTALGALQIIDDASSVPFYIKALHDPSEKVRRSAAEALSGAWDDAAQRALIDVLKDDPSFKVRQRAAETIGTPGVMGRYQAHHQERAADGESALIHALRTDPSLEVRATAALMLGKFKNDKALDPLIEALDDKNAPVRAAAAGSLGSLETPRAVDRLLDVVYFEKDDSVLVNAMKALKYSKDPRIVEPVIQALRSGSQRVRWQAIDVLEILRAPESVPALKSVAADKYESEGIKSRAKEVLQLMGAD